MKNTARFIHYLKCGRSFVYSGEKNSKNAKKPERETKPRDFYIELAFTITTFNRICIHSHHFECHVESIDVANILTVTYERIIHKQDEWVFLLIHV